MKLLIVPSWYPTKSRPESGSFFRDSAIILKNYGLDIVIAAPVMHSFRDLLNTNINKNIQFSINNNIPTYRLEFVNLFPKFENLQYSQYKKNTLLLIENVINHNWLPDVILAHSSIWAGSSITEYCNKLNIPLIVVEHLKEFLMPTCWSKLNNQLINTTYNTCSAIITPSSKLKHNIINLFPNSKNKISIIPNPVDEEIFIQKKNKINDVFSIICVALFRQEKRLDLLINSFKKLIDTGINAKLTLVGDGPLKYKLLNLINKLSLSPYINVKGYLSQDLLVKELHKNDVLVSASEVETFGITLIEAQSCGLPIIATNCGGPSDIISSKTGILIQPNSINELLKALITINQSLKNYNSQIIRKITINKFGKLKYYNSIKNAISI